MEDPVLSTGVVNSACDVEPTEAIEDADGGKSLVNNGEDVAAAPTANGTGEKGVVTKHARFKIINHSQSMQSLEAQIDLGEEEEGKENETAQEPRERERTLTLPHSSLTKRRQSEHSTHHSHFDGLTNGYSSTEAVPMTVFYRNEHSLSNIGKKRPTLHELHKGHGKSNKQSPVGFISFVTYLYVYLFHLELITRINL